MKKFKTIVKSLEESKAVQEALFAMGYGWFKDPTHVCVINKTVLYAVLYADKDGTITWDYLECAYAESEYPLYILHTINDKPFLIPEEIPKKHRDVYCACEQGREIEFYCDPLWLEVSHPPSWSIDMSYRVKPQPSDKKPHKHAELIKAWADGAEIQILVGGNEWVDIVKPLWDGNTYRIKPEEKPIQTYYVKSGKCVVESEGHAPIDMDIDFSKYNIVITYNPNIGKIENITWENK